eukprot:2933211-Prymnesium_polylepis.1
MFKLRGRGERVVLCRCRPRRNENKRTSKYHHFFSSPARVAARRPRRRTSPCARQPPCGARRGR